MENIVENIIELSNSGKHHEAWKYLENVEIDDLNKITMYTYKYLESYYVGRKDIGREVLDSLCKLGIDDGTYNMLLNNYNWYTLIIPGTVIKLNPTAIGKLIPMNISLCKYNNKIHLFHRYINYIINESNGCYSYVESPNTILNVNCLEVLDEEYQVCKSIIIKTTPEQLYKSISIGMEDGRIFLYNNELYVSGTCWGTNPEANAGQINLAKIKNDELVDITPLNFNTKITQKNWLPITEEVNNRIYGTNTIKWIYGWNPFTIIEMNEEKQISILYECNVPLLSRAKGSSGPIPYLDGYLTLVHENNSKAPRLYYHRFVYHDKNMKPIKASRMFKLQNKTMEFISGMIIDNDKLIIGFTLLDKDTSLFILNVNEIENMLYNIS